MPVSIGLDGIFVFLFLPAAQNPASTARGLLTTDLAGETLGVSLHVVRELLTGVELSARAREERSRVSGLLAALAHVRPGLEFPATDARTLAFLTRSGERISAMDLLIATSALEAGAPLVTPSRCGFERVPAGV